MHSLPAFFRSHAVRALLCLTAAGLASPAQASADDAEAYEQLRRDDVQLASVAFTVLTRNADRCGTAVAPQSGLVLHARAQYQPRDRAGAGRHFGLGRWPGVMGVVAGSPAARAGFRQDDQLLAVNGRSLADTGDADAAPSRATVDRAERIVAEELARGPATLAYRRRGRDAEAVVTAVAGCASRVELLADDRLNAWADGERIIVGARLLEACGSDDDLAFVIAHELAHNLFWQTRRKRVAGTVEIEADRLAVEMAAAAGFDPQRAIRTWSAAFRRAGASATHPAPVERIAALEADDAARRAPAGLP